MAYEFADVEGGSGPGLNEAAMSRIRGYRHYVFIGVHDIMFIM